MRSSGRQKLLSWTVLASILLFVSYLEVRIHPSFQLLAPELRSTLQWTIVLAGLLLPIASFFGTRGSSNLKIILGFFGGWTLVVLGISIYVGGVFFSLIQVLFLFLWVVFWMALGKYFLKSYRDPGLHWYSDSPKYITRLSATVESSESDFFLKNLKWNVSRMDEEGLYLIQDSKEVSIELKKLKRLSGKVLEFRLDLDGQRVNGRGVVAQIRMAPLGIGIRHKISFPDQDKELQDLLERLRVGGYAN